MAPWDEMVYFVTPTMAVVALTTPPAAPVQLCAANPLRVALVISSISTTQSAFIGPTTAAAPTNGIQLPPQSPTIMITQKDFGALVQSAWFGAGAGSVSVVEVIMRDWPDRPAPQRRKNVRVRR